MKYEDVNYDSTYFYTRQYINYSLESNDIENILLGYTALEFYAYQFKKYEECYKIATEADEVINSILNNDNFPEYAEYYFDHINNYSVALFNKKKINRVKELLHKAISKSDNIEVLSELQNSYLSLFFRTLFFTDELQLKLYDSVELLSKSSEYAKKSSEDFTCLNDDIFSEFYKKTGNRNEAIRYAISYKNCSEQRYKSTQNWTYRDDFNRSIINIAELYILYDSTEAAQNYIHRTIGNTSDNIFLSNRILCIKAGLAYKRGEILKAKKKFSKALLTKNQNSITSIHKATILQSLAQIYHTENKLDSTLFYYQQALIKLNKDFTDKDVENNPTFNGSKIYAQETIDILYQKSAVFLEKYQAESDICHLYAAQASTQTAQDAIDVVRIELNSNFDKELFAKKAYKVFQQALQIAALSETFEKDEANVAFAFRAMEASRAQILAEAVYKANAKVFADIPEDLISREEMFRMQILETEREIYQLEERQEDARDYYAKKMQQRTNFNAFIDSLRVEYPNYYDLKFTAKLPDLKDLQRDLAADNQVFVEYFLGDENIYALLVQADSVALKTWKKSPRLAQQVQALRKAIYTESDSRKSLEGYIAYADTLYRSLVEPLGDLPERVTIVPDGVLNYLSFDMLLTSVPEANGRYSSYDYWLNEKQVSYSYSATLRMQKKTPSVSKNRFIGFAPHYNPESSKATRGIGKLKHNSTEVQKIEDNYGGKSYIGALASKEKFTEQCGHARVVHFAGHAIQKGRSLDGSHLLFSSNTDDATENQFPVSEIYARHIPAEMVVLSACNTGMGQMQRGEGVYSLGRAFSYAGAQSLVSSLWAVDDASTADIMELFYEQLALGLDKDTALQAAKIAYINAQDQHPKAHPRYWAGFVAFGNMDALTPPSWWEQIWGY